MARSRLGAAAAAAGLAVIAGIGVARAQQYAAVLSGFNEVGLLNTVPLLWLDCASSSITSDTCRPEGIS
jgi:hypothetical protein